MENKLQELKEFCLKNKIAITGTVADIKTHERVSIDFYTGLTSQEPKFFVEVIKRESI